MGCHCLSITKEEMSGKEEIEKLGDKCQSSRSTSSSRVQKKNKENCVKVEEIQLEEQQKQVQTDSQTIDELCLAKHQVNYKSDLIIKQNNSRFEQHYQIILTFENDYDIKVHQVSRYSDNVQFIAYQLINNKFNHNDSFQNSLKNLYNIQHENIIQIYEYFKGPISTYIITEYCNGNTLKKEIEMRRQNDMDFTEYELLSICKQLLLACSHMHSQNFIHLEINPSNIIVIYDENKNIIVKLQQTSILQLKKISSLSKPQQINIKYLAPELVLTQYVNEKSDV